MAARLSHLNKNKLVRYFNNATPREILEALIKVSEKNSYIKNKLTDEIKNNNKEK